ncbi:hypothetical protein GCM10027448_09530 [Nocardioides dilutus]
MLRRHRRAFGAAVALAVLALLVGALGGWARTTPDDVRVLEPGVEVEVTPLRVSLDRAEAAYELFGRAAEPGRAYVVVEGALALGYHESVGSDIVTAAFAADLPTTYSYYNEPGTEGELSSLLVADDGSSLLGLGPGLDYRVLVVFDIDEADVPTELTVTLLKHVRRASSLDVSTVGWFDPEPFARVTLDVAPLPDERPSEEAW